jgi:hypothetical protein
VRERLGHGASDGIRALSRIAGMMTQRISFGLSVRELDRLSDREGVSGTLLHALQDANILDRRGDRVSFSHEMFLNVFAAESIVRQAGDDPEAVVAALRLPQHLEMTPFVLGAIDDDSFRRQVLPHVSDARVIQVCLAGQCGLDAQLWANDRCNKVLARVREEIETVRFEVSDAFMWHVQQSPTRFRRGHRRIVPFLQSFPRNSWRAVVSTNCSTSSGKWIFGLRKNTSGYSMKPRRRSFVCKMGSMPYVMRA